MNLFDIASCFENEPKCMPKASILLNFTNQFQKCTHILNNRKSVPKSADHTNNPPAKHSSVALHLTPAAYRERREQLEAWTVKHNWACELLDEWMCVYWRVHRRIRMRQYLWHKAWPQLDLSLCWMPVWRQSDIVWLHTSAEEDMEKICGAVNLGDYVAPLGSGLHNASNPLVPCHCNLGAFVFRANQISIPSCHRWSPTSTMRLPMSTCAWERSAVCVCVCVHKRGGLCVEIAMDQLKHNIGLIFLIASQLQWMAHCSCLHEQLLA